MFLVHRREDYWTSRLHAVSHEVAHASALRMREREGRRKPQEFVRPNPRAKQNRFNKSYATADLRIGRQSHTAKEQGAHTETTLDGAVAVG